MEEQKVSYETAILAKQKGYNWPCTHLGYWCEGVLQIKPIANMNATTPADTWCSMPSQSMLQKWLRDEKDSNITIEYHPASANGLGARFTHRYSMRGMWFAKYEEALEDALEIVLKMQP